MGLYCDTTTMPLLLDATTDAARRTVLDTELGTGTLTVEVLNGSDSVVFSGTIAGSTDWTTAETVVSNVSLTGETGAGGTPDSTWSLRVRNSGSTRWVRFPKALWSFVGPNGGTSISSGVNQRVTIRLGGGGGGATQYVPSTPPSTVDTWLLRSTDPAVVVPTNFLGIHSDYVSGVSPPPINPGALMNNVGTVRSLNMSAGLNESNSYPRLSWWAMEPTQGVYYWTDLDAWVSQHTGKTLIYTVFLTPAFYQKYSTAYNLYPSYPSATSPPVDWTKAANLINAILARHPTQTWLFELWNEPNFGYGQYGDGSQIAYEDRFEARRTDEWIERYVPLVNGKRNGAYFCGTPRDLAEGARLIQANSTCTLIGCGYEGQDSNSTFNAFSLFSECPTGENPSPIAVTESLVNRWYWDPTIPVASTASPAKRNVMFTGHLARNYSYHSYQNDRADLHPSFSSTGAIVDTYDSVTKLARVKRGSSYVWNSVVAKGEPLDAFDTYRMKFYPNYGDSSTRIPHAEETWIAFAFKTPANVIGGSGTIFSTSISNSGDSGIYAYFSEGNAFEWASWYNPDADTARTNHARSSDTSTLNARTSLYTTTLPTNTWVHVVMKVRLSYQSSDNPYLKIWQAVGTGALTQVVDNTYRNAWNTPGTGQWSFPDVGMYWFEADLSVVGDYSGNDDPWNGASVGTQHRFSYAGCVCTSVSTAGSCDQHDFRDWLAVRSGTYYAGASTGKTWLDGVSIHSYTYDGNGSKIIDETINYKSLLATYGYAASIPVYNTETGHEGQYAYQYSDAQNARNVKVWAWASAALGLKSISLYKLSSATSTEQAQFLKWYGNPTTTAHTASNTSFTNAMSAAGTVNGMTIGQAALLADGNLWLESTSNFILTTAPTAAGALSVASLQTDVDTGTPHEMLMDGVPPSWDWGTYCRAGIGANPPTYTGWGSPAWVPWGHCATERDNPPGAHNWRVAIYAIRHYERRNGTWQSSGTQVTSYTQIDGGYYTDYETNTSVTADQRTNNGYLEVKLPDAGGVYHFYPTFRTAMTSGAEHRVVMIKCALTLDNPAGIDDRAAARAVMVAGGDWYKTMVVAPGAGNNYDFWIGRARKPLLSASYSWHCAHTMTNQSDISAFYNWVIGQGI